MTEQKTHEKFLKDLKDVNPNVECITFYTNNHTKVKLRCLICGNEWWITPANALKGRGCPECAKKNRIKHRTTSLDKLLIHVLEVWGYLIQYISGYTTTNEKCLWRCTFCGNVFEAIPQNILHRHGCPVCGKKLQCTIDLPLEELLQRIELIYMGFIIYIEGYVDLITKCAWKCTKCGKEWKATPRDLLFSYGCPYCTDESVISYFEKRKNTPKKRIIKKKKRENTIRKNTRVSLSVFLERLKAVWGDAIIYVSGYVKITAKCLFRCRYGHEWEARPDDVLHGKGCPFCASSSMEKPVQELLNKLNVKYKHDVPLEGSNYNGSKAPLRVDFIIETEAGKLAIETDGEQHFLPIFGEEVLKFQREKDKHKDKILKERGYILIRATSKRTKKYATDRHLVMHELFRVLSIGINKETGGIDFELFRNYDFNRE